MNEDKFTQAYKDEQRIKDEAMAHNIHQLAFGSTSAGSILSAASITSNASTFERTAATNLHATGVSSQPYYKKEVDDASLFMDDKLKISAASPYDATPSNNMHKLDYISAISLSSSCAITEYFNIIYYDLLRAHGSKGKYEINDTKNVVKHQHLNLLTQTFENIAQYSRAFNVGKIIYKWENLHKALI